jgi:hypothetical protein
VAKSKQQAEFGDFQTPLPLAHAVCDLLRRLGSDPAAVAEPTCGQGNLLLAALDHFPNATTALGLDVNAGYLAGLETALAGRAAGRKVRLVHGDFFATDWVAMLAELPEPLLVLGNPPWVTSAALGALASGNVPQKSNFQRHAGLDAITGKSNFDISEWMLIRLLEALHGRCGTLAMLCKTAVARKLLLHAWNHDLSLSAATLYGIDATRHFNANVAACLLVCDFQPGSRQQRAGVFPELAALQPSSELGWRGGRVVAQVDTFDRWSHLAADGTDRTYVWRSGVKHDAARVMELRAVAGRWYNKLGQCVDLEPTYLYPLLKGSEIASGRIARPAHAMLVTQTNVNSPTAAIREIAPQTWQYLLAHAPLLDGRRSSIYRRRPRFSMFGVGDYTFAPYKVAICGLYKKLRFEVVGCYEGKPVVFDDTVSFLACSSRCEAERLARLLNSEPAREFYSASIFWDAKRPVTIDVLKRLDLRKLAEYCDRPGSDDRRPLTCC